MNIAVAATLRVKSMRDSPDLRSAAAPRTAHGSAFLHFRDGARPCRSAHAAWPRLRLYAPRTPESCTHALESGAGTTPIDVFIVAPMLKTLQNGRDTP